MGLQSRGSLRWRDFGTPTRESWERSKVYYNGEGGGFPQVRAVVSLVCPCCLWLLAPKVLQLCINHFVWVVCRLVWMREVCQLFLVPSRSSNTPLYPSKCCELGSVPRLLILPLSFTWTHIWVLLEVGSASLYVLTHFRTLHFITNHFPFYFFPSIVNNIHIISTPSIVLSSYEHF
jgi:hypothetical protein